MLRAFFLLKNLIINAFLNFKYENSQFVIKKKISKNFKIFL